MCRQQSHVTQATLPIPLTIVCPPVVECFLSARGSRQHRVLSACVLACLLMTSVHFEYSVHNNMTSSSQPCLFSHEKNEALCDMFHLLLSTVEFVLSSIFYNLLQNSIYAYSELTSLYRAIKYNLRGKSIA